MGKIEVRSENTKLTPVQQSYNELYGPRKSVHNNREIVITVMVYVVMPFGTRKAEI
jgi:hypothetical protein